jgi:acyl-CoA synthetase (AMP-forming)/AMP-acid ligase II/acyl carrier protein
MDLNYFTCTLGEAAKHGLTEPQFENISSFLDYQAEHIPNAPAAGFFSPQKDEAPWTTKTYSFEELRSISLAVAERLNGEREVARSKTVALLCPSTAEFMFLWLGLIRLDIAVLLLAPQCQSDAIVHLCRECEANILFYHRAYEKAANEAVLESMKGESNALDAIDIARISSEGLDSFLIDVSSVPSKERASKAGLNTIAYIHHTSGTSSGLPKPIHQAHNAAVGALPKIPNSLSKATFTTTPLYHGGIADAFRSWTSGAMIWLFPGKDVPITAPNIVKALDAAAKRAKEGNTPVVAYFSSVPYVLQLLEEDARGLNYLRQMDIVGVGGAALPNEVGGRLVKGGVNVVSRFGSSECGFLMSSHRAYDKEQSWQFLRDNVGSGFLCFEPRDDGLSELVVLPSWPHRAKTNREDGSFATADLFEPHPSIPNAWRYHSRADSQLTLITGKKFDPAPLEGALADSPLVADALIFGNYQPYPGVLLFRSQEGKDMSDDEIVEKLWPMLDQLNARSQDHARIARDTVRPMPWQAEPLEKSSKGTLIRKKVEARFAKDIEAAYAEKEVDGADRVTDEEIEGRVLEIVELTLGRSEKLDRNTDLFSYGVDSIAAMRIRGRLQGLLGKEKKPLPATVVESCGSVKKISQLIIDLRNGKTSTSESVGELKLMEELVDEYSQFIQQEDAPQTNGYSGANAESRETIILTGATGALGTHVLALCVDNPRVLKVICLIRGEDEHAARARLNKALGGRKLSPLSNSNVEVEVLPLKLGDPKLGLSDEVHARLAGEATVILHLAWEVNFRMNLRSFRSNSIASK